MRYAVVAVLFLAACATSPGRLVDRAVEAAGGEDALSGIHGYRVTTEGTYQGRPYRATGSWRAPRDWAWHLDSMDMRMAVWLLGDDHKTYMATGGMLLEPEGPQREYWIGMYHVGHAMMFPDRLRAPGVRLEKAEHVRIGDERDPALVAYFGDSDPVTYVFDRHTHLVKRVMLRAVAMETGQKTDMVIDVGDYRDVDGVMVAHESRMVSGEPAKMVTIEEHVTGVEWNPAFEETVFEPKAEAASGEPPRAPPEVLVREEPETLIAAHRFVGPYGDVGKGIEKVMAWIGQHGTQMRISGPVTLIYRGPPPADPTQAETYIQVPVETEARPPKGEVRLQRRRAFQFAYTVYEGPVEQCHTLIPVVESWVSANGYERTGSHRVAYLEWDEASGNCRAEVGFPVRKSG